VGAAQVSVGNRDHGPVASAEVEFALAGPPRGERLSETSPTNDSEPSAAIAAQQPRATPGGRRELLAAGAIAALLAIGVGAATLDGGGALAHRKSFTVSAQPFTFTYNSPWRSATAAVPGMFALSASSLHGASDQATSSDRQPVRLVSGEATLAAGELRTSASIPGGIPPALVRRYGHRFAAVDAQIAGHSGREYRWSATGSQVVAYVLPTPTRDSAIICQAPASATAALDACGALAAGAHTPNGQILAPGPDRELARAIAGPLKSVNAARSTVGRLRGPMSARHRRAVTVSLTEAHATTLLRKIAPPPRYRQAITQVTAALSREAAAFTALARAARSNKRNTYSRAVRGISAASRALQAAGRRLGFYELGDPELGVLHLGGPPPPPHQTPVITGTVQPSVPSGATSGSGRAPPPPAASGSSGNGTSTTYVTPFS
jgi:hypothetical protein